MTLVPYHCGFPLARMCARVRDDAQRHDPKLRRRICCVTRNRSLVVLTSHQIAPPAQKPNYRQTKICVSMYALPLSLAASCHERAVAGVQRATSYTCSCDCNGTNLVWSLQLPLLFCFVEAIANLMADFLCWRRCY